MLKTERQKRICEKYSARDETGHVHCSECPLVISNDGWTCRACFHYDRHLHEWVEDDEEVSE